MALALESLELTALRMLIVQSVRLSTSLTCTFLPLLYCSTDVGATTRLEENLTSALQDVEDWTNKLPLNESKTKSLLVSGKRLKEKLPSQADLLSITTSTCKVVEQVHSGRFRHWFRH